MHTALMVQTLIVNLHYRSGVAVGCDIMQSIFLHTFIKTGITARTESTIK